MRARFKGPNGTGVLALDDDATVGQLLDAVKEQSGIAGFTVKYGWPLKTIDKSQRGENAKALGLNGETLTIVPDEVAAPTPPPPSRAAAPSSSTAGWEDSPFGGPQPPTKGPEGVSVPWPEREGVMLLRVMPDDNSCLFTAFGGALPKQLPVPQLRKMIADHILSHPDEYSEAILGLPPREYATKIQGRDRWGGAIEMSIFSDIFDMQIVALDVKDQRKYEFGEHKDSRCILVYSGIHYDRVALSPAEPPHYRESDLPPELDRTIWPTDDDAVVAKAHELLAQLNDMHYYTDPAEILLRCNVPGCGWMGSGQRAGAQHASLTGHTALSEIEDNALLKCNTAGCDWLGSGEKEAKKHTSDSGHGSLTVIPDY